jgi:siroheme synthase
MASRKLAANLDAVVRAGRAPTTPAAYIASATTPAQTVVVGTLADLAVRVAGVDPSAPAIVIIGDVVSVRDRIRAMGSGPQPVVAARDARSLA